ncbi:MAG: hypothetical protein JXB07_15215, partial [Anaerolineae bacterium]|nr:hypothetical protein [Anaerolineae bacterium]
RWIPACAGMTSRSGNVISFLNMFTNNLFPYHGPVYHPKTPDNTLRVSRRVSEYLIDGTAGDASRLRVLVG